MLTLLAVLSLPVLKGSCQYVVHSNLWMSGQNLGCLASRRIGWTCCQSSSVRLGASAVIPFRPFGYPPTHVMERTVLMPPKVP